MNNENEILKRILLNMKYDSRKTLSENSYLVNDQVKPSVTVGDVETIGVLPSETTNTKNIVSSVDFLGKPLIFNGTIYKTSKQFFDELSTEVSSDGEFAYRDKPKYVNSVQYVGPESGRNYFKSYKENKITLGELKYQVGAENVEFKQKISGYEYKKNTLGYFASRCRQSLQSDIKEKMSSNPIRYQGEEWYEEPKGVKECVIESIKSVSSKLKPNSVFSFWAIDPKTNSKEYFYLRFSCGIETTSYETEFAALQQSQLYGKEIKPDKVLLTTKCDSSTVRFSGYKTVDGKEWDKVKKENVKHAEATLKNKEEMKSNTEDKDIFNGTNKDSMGGDRTINLGMSL